MQPLFPGSALRWVDLRGSDNPIPEADIPVEFWQDLLQNSFGDGSVTLPANAPRPCQWLSTRFTEEKVFFGTWRAWLEKGGQDWPPSELYESEITMLSSRDDLRAGLVLTGKLADIEVLPDNIPEDCVWQE